jgi:hypothetical protein
MVFSCQLSRVSGLFSVFFVFRLQAPFNPFDILLRWQAFEENAPFQQGVAHRLVVGDVLIGNLNFTVHLVLEGVEDGDFRGEVFGLEQNCGRKIGQWAAFGHFPLRFHGLGAFAKQGVVAFAADEREVLVAASLFVDDL